MGFCNFSSYLTSINKIPLLSLREEKIFLLKLKNSNDILAAHYLVLSHLRYVIKIAKNYVYFGILLSDLIQEGSVGLMKSIKRYDLSKNTRLISFAIYWIKAEIYSYIIKNYKFTKNIVSMTKGSKKNNLSFLNTLSTYDISEQVSVFSNTFKYYDKDNFFHYFTREESFFFNNSFNSYDLKLIFKYLVFEIIVKIKWYKRLLFLQRWFCNNHNVATYKFLGFCYNISSEYARQIEIKIIKKIKVLLLFFM